MYITSAMKAVWETVPLFEQSYQNAMFLEDFPSGLTEDSQHEGGGQRLENVHPIHRNPSTLKASYKGQL